MFSVMNMQQRTATLAETAAKKEVGTRPARAKVRTRTMSQRTVERRYSGKRMEERRVLECSK
jgi:hypothetical protein